MKSDLILLFLNHINQTKIGVIKMLLQSVLLIFINDGF